jgi:HK97 family phage portal protein
MKSIMTMDIKSMFNVTAEQSYSSTGAAELLIQPFSDAGRFGWRNLQASAAWQYYKQISVIRDAVDLGADSFVTVPFAIQDKNTKELFTEYDPKIPATGILKLLEKPNQDITESEFKKSQYTTYQVTGDTFMLVTAVGSGTPTDEAGEIYYINSRDVSSTEDTDNITNSYHITTGKFRGRYIREELDDDRIIYWNKNTGHQLWIMKTFNPDSFRSGRGFSKLSSVYYEIEQHCGVSKHNNALLHNGVRPSGAVIPDKPTDHQGSILTDEQVVNLKQSIQKFYGGANNAGNVMVLDGIKEFKQLSMNNKDMEFMQLLQFVKEQVYTNLNIPLPLINAKTMTLRNFEEAKFMLFDLNIIPFAQCYAEELNLLLMPRYDDSGYYEFVVNENMIPAIEVRKMAKIDLFKDDLTINERRALINFEELPDGDVLAPVSQQVNPDQKSKEEFIDALRDKGMNEDEVQKKAHQIYGCH